MDTPTITHLQCFTIQHSKRKDTLSEIDSLSKEDKLAQFLEGYKITLQKKEELNDLQGKELDFVTLLS